MRHKIFAFLGIFAMLVALLPASLPASAAQDLPDPQPVDAGPEIRAMKATPEMIEPMSKEELAQMQAAAEALVKQSPDDCITDAKIFLILNDFTGRYQATYFNLMGTGPLTQLWVQQNLAFPVGDPRATPVITCDQVTYMIGEFETTMYPIETSFFGMPAPHDGTNAYLPSLLGLPADYYFDEAGRQIVLVSNIRDANYYDPNYPIYIAGFYSPTFEIYFDRNVMSIDAFDWENRTGPGGTRPYAYEGIFAHEYQHLLHDDYDSDEENFINEGMADLAMVLTGYGVSGSHLRDAAAYPENSLTLWGDQGDLEILTDYGQAYLFQLYLMEQFGQKFIQDLFHNPTNGVASIEEMLAAYHSPRSFAELFRDWSVAMLIDSRIPGNGRYNFKGEAFNLNIGTPEAPNPQAFDTPGAPPWGTDYIWITADVWQVPQLVFDGDNYAMFPTAWTSDGSVLWGGEGDLADHWAIFPAHVPAASPTLTFDTMYTIEELWDFGFVQVSTDGGHTWTSLANAYTTSDHDPNAHPKVIENLPGLTGDSGGWVNMSFDLSAYAGQDVLIAFRYVTDWATTESGWFIDNVYVDDVLISDGSSVAPFKDLTEILPIELDFMVTFVAFRGGNKGNLYRVQTLRLDDVSEVGKINLNPLLKFGKVAMLVTLKAPADFPYYGGYTYSIVPTRVKKGSVVRTR